MKLSRSDFLLLLNKPCWREKYSRCVHLLRTRPHVQTGFTLTELMIVLAIVAVLAAVGGVSINNQMPRYRLRGDARSIASSLMIARMKATAAGLQYAIHFNLDLNPHKYTLQQGNSNAGSTAWSTDLTYQKRLSPTVSIDRVVDDNGTHSSGIARIIFNPTGSAGTGEVYVGADTDHGYKITVTSTTGRIQNTKGW